MICPLYNLASGGPEGARFLRALAHLCVWACANSLNKPLLFLLQTSARIFFWLEGTRASGPL